VATIARLGDAIVTAEVVEHQVPKGSTIISVGPKAILTPAALDVVRARKLTIQRESAAKTVANTVAARRLAIVVRSTPVLERRLQMSAPTWRRELLGCPDDAATLAISAICRGEVDAVAIFATQQHRAACLANRNERIKAAALSSVDEIKLAAAQIRLNVVCVDPTNRPDFELRRWLEAIASLETKPSK
jgi:hypothetical protein